MTSRARAFSCVVSLAPGLVGAGCGGNDGELPTALEDIPTVPPELPGDA